MPRGTVLVECNGGLARITLNRPEVLNAMNLAWVRALEAAVNTVATEPDVRVVLVRGAGRAFCAGLDLDMLGRDGIPPGFYEGQERAFCGLEAMDKITIAVLHGYCLGGGLQLAIACDIRVSSTECGLGLPAVLEGLFPGMAPFRLPRRTCRWHTTGCSCWMNGPSVAAMCSRSYASRLRMVSQGYDLACVLNLSTFVDFAARIRTSRGLGRR
jgi:enoyl-CoA hydratase/carnithine racemase